MNVIISQAMASGLPVITTRHSGLPEQVTEGYNGFLVEEGDYKALAERILYLLNNVDILPKLGENSRSLVSEKYNSKKLITHQIEIYDSIIKE